MLVELFQASLKEGLKLTISDKIWLIIIELVAKLPKIFNTDTETVMQTLISEKETLIKYVNLGNLKQVR